MKIAAILLIAISIAGADSIPRIDDSIPKDSVRNSKIESAVPDRPGGKKRPANVDSVPPRPRVVLDNPQRRVNIAPNQESLGNYAKKMGTNSKPESHWRPDCVAIGTIGALLGGIISAFPETKYWFGYKNQRTNAIPQVKPAIPTNTSPRIDSLVIHKSSRSDSTNHLQQTPPNNPLPPTIPLRGTR